MIDASYFLDKEIADILSGTVGSNLLVNLNTFNLSVNLKTPGRSGANHSSTININIKEAPTSFNKFILSGKILGSA